MAKNSIGSSIIVVSMFSIITWLVKTLIDVSILNDSGAVWIPLLKILVIDLPFLWITYFQSFLQVDL